MCKKKLIRITTVSSSFTGLLKGQLRYLNKYYEVVGVASGKEKLLEVERIEGIRTIDVPMDRKINLLSDFKSLVILIRVFLKESPFIVHANTPKGSLLAMISSYLTRVPHRIYTVTGLRFETTTGSFRWLLIFMERLTCFCATKVIPEGDGVKETLIKHKITKKPLKKILNGNINGVDLLFFDRTLDVVEKSKKFKRKEFTFCFVGRIVKDKGINELISVFTLAQKKYKHIHLYLVGDFEDELDPIALETKSTIFNNESISFMGFQEDVRPYLAASDLLVFPSYREGFPNVVLQAGAMGLPSIVTDINGCNEIIVNGENGLLIPSRNEVALYEAMTYLIENKNIVNYMASNARIMIERRFEQKKVWEALLIEYQSLT